jgi:hypothetical protein
MNIIPPALATSTQAPPPLAVLFFHERGYDRCNPIIIIPAFSKFSYTDFLPIPLPQRGGRLLELEVPARKTICDQSHASRLMSIEKVARRVPPSH